MISHKARSLTTIGLCALSLSSIAEAQKPVSQTKNQSQIVSESKKEQKLLVRISEDEALTQPQKAVMQKTSTVGALSPQEQHLKAIELALKGDAKSSIQILKPLSELVQNPDEKDRVLLSLGRVKYQSGDAQGALEAYNLVRKGGASWLEALEERANAQLRLGQAQNALASLKTVLTPIFKDRILSEPFYLTALAQLRVCDYKSVFKTIDLFKNRFRDQIKTWESASLDDSSQMRLREARETIQKLNLIEAEAIQHLYVDESGRKQAGTPPKIGRERDELTFPMDPDMDNKEVWLDEVDDYRVTVKGCPQSIESVGLISQKLPISSTSSDSQDSRHSPAVSKKARTL